MTPYSIVYKKDDKSNLKAVTFWQKKYGVLRASYLFKLCFVIDFFGAFLSFFSMRFEDDYNFLGTCLFVILEVAVFTFITVRSVKGKFIIEMAKRADERINQCSDKTEITLRDNDFEIKTQYKKTNYFYDEVEYCFNMGSFAIIIVDKYTYPITISLNSLLKGSKEEFSSLLGEKLRGKYERGVYGQ